MGKEFFLFVLRQVVFAVSTRKILMGTKDDRISVKVITLVLGSMEIAQGNVKEGDPKGGGICVFQPQYDHFSVCILPKLN